MTHGKRPLKVTSFAILGLIKASRERFCLTKVNDSVAILVSIPYRAL